MGDLGSDKEHGGTVGTGGGTGTAADAGGGIHCLVGNSLGNENGGGIRSSAGVLRDEAPGTHDAFVGTSIHDEILKDREGTGTEGFDGDGVAILEFPHVDLAGRTATGALGNTIDHETTGAADSLPAVTLKGHRLLARGNEAVVDNVEHLKKGTLGRNVSCLDILKFS